MNRTSKSVNGRAVVVEGQREAERLAKVRAPLVVTTHHRRARFQALFDAAPGVGADMQADRLLKALRGGPMTSFQARQYLDIACPASRIHTLRHERGIDILCTYVRQASTCGTVHVLGSYSIAGRP